MGFQDAIAIAQSLIDLYGSDALKIVEQRVLENMKAADFEADSLWRAVADAARVLLKEDR